MSQLLGNLQNGAIFSPIGISQLLDDRKDETECLGGAGQEVYHWSKTLRYFPGTVGKGNKNPARGTKQI